jgi:hypothetical protein
MSASQVLRALAGAACFFAVGFSSAATIAFTPVDLVDTTPGQDLWQYRYAVSGAFVPGGGFNVLFAPILYSALPNPPPSVNADWLISVTQPDLVLPADGLYTATALVATPSLANPFVLDFVWLGSGTPGAQPFEVFDDTFAVTQTGVSTAASPVAVSASGTLSLAAGALLLFGAMRRTRDRV